MAYYSKIGQLMPLLGLNNGMLQRLSKEFGIADFALQWFESYFVDRKQSVIINGINSDTRVLAGGVPRILQCTPNHWVTFYENMALSIIPSLMTNSSI